jgi:23S rRNA (adenine2503-C2)-methyltransferase
MAFLLASAVKQHRSAAAFVPRSTRSSLSSLVHVSSQEAQQLINLHTIPKEELEQVLQSWGFPKYRANQVITWVRQGATDVTQMTNIPLKLRETLQQFATVGSLTLDMEEVSKDGTKKRAYRLHDGQLIESVLMPYDDGRYTACISSQAGCAMGCVFCATGQMGFARQLSSEEIFEQVSRFSSELSKENSRLSNVVFMGTPRFMWILSLPSFYFHKL